MKLKANFKNGMILGEVIFAFFLCGILLGISIYMFKSNDVSKTPYIYSVLKNFPTINKTIMEECYADGSCDSYTELPESTAEYCERLAGSVATAGNVNCTVAGNTTIKFDDLGQNFQLANGVSFYNVNPRDGWNKVRLDATDVNDYIDVYIDVNGSKNGDNVFGEDVFPIRIFRNGAVVPSVNFDKNFDARDDEEFFAYRILLNKALNEDNPNSRVIEVVDARTPDEISDELPFREKVSLKEAICTTNPELFKRYFQGEVCDGYTILPACNFDSGDSQKYPHLNDKSAYCTFEPVKPRGSGIFKIFGI